MLLSRALGDLMHQCSDLEPYRPMTAAPPTGPRMAPCGPVSGGGIGGGPWEHLRRVDRGSLTPQRSLARLHAEYPGTPTDTSLARPVEAEFDYAGGDLPRAVAAGGAGDVKLGGEG